MNINRLKLFLLILISLLISTYAGAELAELSVHFIDVGQGDAILIHSAETTVLIDGGDRWNWVAETLIAYLLDQDVDTIDAVLSTHPHADHIGGLPAILNAFEVKQIYDSGKVHTTATYENYLSSILELGIPYKNPRRGDVLEVGDLSLQVLHPTDDVEEYSINNASIVVRLVYGEVSFLFTGDAEKEAEKELIESGMELHATILKVGHHGSNTSSTPEFLDTVQPEAAIIMCGIDNQFGHPHNRTIRELLIRNISIYCTAWHDTIVVFTDGVDFWIQTGPESSLQATPPLTWFPQP